MIDRFLNIHDIRDRDYIYTTKSRRVLREWSRTTQWLTHERQNVKYLNISISASVRPARFRDPETLDPVKYIYLSRCHRRLVLLNE